MEYKFRNTLLNNDNNFKQKFISLYNQNKLTDFTQSLWDIIDKDKTLINFNGTTIYFKDLFENNLTEGRCRTCTYELVMLLTHLGYTSYAVYTSNPHIKGTIGSINGGHWITEVILDNKPYYIDTSLMIMGTNFLNDLDYEIIEKQDINKLFLLNKDLKDYYNNMIIQKRRTK